MFNFRRVWGIVVRSVFSWPRELEQVFEAFWWPSFDVFVWGLLTVYLQREQGFSGFLASYIIGAVILWTFVYRAQQEMGFSFIKEAWERNILNIFTTPISIWEFLFASIVLSIIKLAISVTWMVILSYILFQFNIFSLSWYLIPFIVNLMVIGWVCGFVVNGLIIQYGYRIQSFVWTMILVLQPFSGVFYPISILPVWMQMIANALPTSYIFEGMRQVISEGTVSLGLLLTASLLNIVYLFLSIIMFKKSFEKAQETGALVKLS